MTEWMILLLIYIIPIVISVGLIIEYKLYTENIDICLLFMPFVNFFIMIWFVGDALNEIVKAKRRGE